MTTNQSPMELSAPVELTTANIDRLDDDAFGVVLVSKFTHLSGARALAIEAGKIRHVLHELSRSLESSFFFRYRTTETEGEAILIRDLLRSVIGVHKLGE